MEKYDQLDALHPTTDREHFYRRALENFDGGFFATDRNGKCLFVTQSSQYMLGKPPEYLVGRTIFDMVDEGIVDFPATPAVLQDGREHIRYILTNVGVAMEVRSKPIFDENGEIDLIISYVLEEGSSTLAQQRYLESKKKYQELAQKYQNILEYLAEQNENSSSVIAKSPAMLKILQLARRISNTDIPVLLGGESGVGKEVLAHYIHRHSGRSTQPFIAINCAAIPAELAESELFGYEKGAFTGANKEGKPGFFELANKGTLFLDEVGEFPLALQSKLLRILETRTIRRVGGKKETDINVRIIAATNKKKKKEVTEGRFRKDLYYRLNVVPILIPPLRERPEDIVELAQSFLVRYNLQHKTNKVLSREALEAFRQYSWPGNARELRNVVERMAILSPNTELNLDCSLLWEDKLPPRQQADVPIWKKGLSLKACMRNFEEKCISDALSQCQYDIAATARELDIPTSTLYQKIRTYGLRTKPLK